MVDFNKKIAAKSTPKIVDPRKLYETLDRASDTGRLRQVQENVLDNWHQNFRHRRDVILKMHTGQGKTLVGLLMLQSKQVETNKPSVYLCPNRFLIQQTCKQAKQFGIRFCTADGELPQDFLDGDSVLITTAHKLFNGFTKFRNGNQYTEVGTILLDDCHSTIDVIRDACSIDLPASHPAYKKLVKLFETALKSQGAGTFSDLLNGSYDAILPIPYWEWFSRQEELLAVLAEYKESDEIQFAWPILKNIFGKCNCVVSGKSIEISLPVLPLDFFKTFTMAPHRIFMSATVTDDSYLIRGLQLDPAAVTNPLFDPAERWSGEKMILFPGIMDASLDREALVQYFGAQDRTRKYGVVVLTPSEDRTRDWVAYGSVYANREIEQIVGGLQRGNYSQTVAIANRYDGIDLPDDSCRLLILDSRPYSLRPIDAYSEICRAGSNLMLMRCVRSIEQGLGRSVRGEKDYCVCLILGDELSRLLRGTQTRDLLSAQTRAQIEIGMEITNDAKSDIAGGTSPIRALTALINQCVTRDSGWKSFYTGEMGKLGALNGQNNTPLFQMELAAELKFQQGLFSEASKSAQEIIDSKLCEPTDAGWYLQEAARYAFQASQTESNRLQIAAHRSNGHLMAPQTGMEFRALEAISKARMENILSWVRKSPNYGDLLVRVTDVASRMNFGVNAEKFEAALEEMGTALGFFSQRPEKVWKQGPDNQWGVDDGEYFVIECKNEIDSRRHEIHKQESGQMNTACGWFEYRYPGAKAKFLMIAPAKKLSAAAAFTRDVLIIRDKSLRSLVNKFQNFYKEFQNLDLNNITPADVQRFVSSHRLTPADIIKDHTELPIRSSTSTES